MGDVARTIPAASLLRAGWPGAHFAWLVEPAAASLLVGQPWIDEVIVFPRPTWRAALREPARLAELARCLRRLRERRFDLVLDFHALARSAALALATGSRRRVSYARPFARELAWLVATDRAALAPERVSRFERNEGLLRFLGLPGRPGERPLHVDPAARTAWRRRLGSSGTLVAIHPGTSPGAAHKRFPPELLGRVAQELAARHGASIVVTRGPGEEEEALARAVVEASAGAARLAAPTPSLADLAALYAGARLAIAPDTGPLHLAALVGTPVVQLLAATDPVENAPWPATPSRIVRAGGGRGASSAERVGEPPREAVDEGTLRRVLEAAAELLASTRPPAAAELLVSTRPPAAAPMPRAERPAAFA